MKSKLTNLQRNQLEALAEEYAKCKRMGDSVSIDDYVAKHPQLADDIRELFPIVAMLDQAAPTIVQEPAIAIEPGTRLGEYQLLRVIGRGGMGIVYEAEHIALGSLVAIKVLPASRSGPKGRERFQREASAAARMHHPNIVRVFDFGCHGDSLFYVMPLIEGWGLNRLIGNHVAIPDEKADDGSKAPTKHDLAITFAQSDSVSDNLKGNSIEESNDGADRNTASFSVDRTYRSSSSSSRPDDLWSWVARIGCQAADALDYAHSSGVVHRDVKPGNLMIDADNHVYITDFGLAKIIDEHSLTGTGDILGTLRYMPPEAFAGQADLRSDIYGLGLTLYELLADRPALSESERGLLMTAITEGRIAKLQTLVPGVPRDLQTVIHKAIDVDPATRYQTASEFHDDLQRFVSGQPIQARRSTWAYRTSRWISRNRAVSSLTALTVLTLVTGLIVSSIGWSRALTAEANATEMATKEKDAREFAESETAAKVNALSEKQSALDRESTERKYAQAIADFVVEDFLALTTVQGQSLHQSDGLAIVGREASLGTLLDRAARKLEQREDLDPGVRGKLATIIGQSYGHFGNYEIGVRLLEENVDLQKTSFGENSPESYRAQSSLASMYRAMGRHQDAIEILEPLIETAPQNNLESIQYLMICKHNLANAYSGLRRFDDSFRLLNEVHQWRLENLTPEHKETLFSKSSIASYHYRIGHFDKAIAMFEELVETQSALPGGTDSKVTQLEQASLAAAYSAVKRFDEAERLFLQILDKLEESLEPNHPDIHLARNNLATVYLEQGKYSQALPLFERAQAGIDATLSKKHLHSLMIAKNIGRLHHLKKDRRNALAAYQQVLERCRLNFEEDDPQTMSAKSSIAYNYWQLGNTDESIPIYEYLLKTRKRLFSDTDVRTLRTKLNLGVNYRDAKRYEDSIRLMEEALAQIEGKHPNLLWVKDQLRVAYVKTGNREAMVKILESQIPQVRNQRVPGSIDLANYLTLCISDLFRVSEVDMAEVLLREVIAIREKKSPMAWQIFNARLSLGRCLTEQAKRMKEDSDEETKSRKLQEAKALLEEGYRGLKANAARIPEMHRVDRLTSAVKSLVVWAKVAGDEAAVRKWSEVLKESEN